MPDPFDLMGDPAAFTDEDRAYWHGVLDDAEREFDALPDHMKRAPVSDFDGGDIHPSDMMFGE